MASSEIDAALAAVPSEAPTIYWRIGDSAFDEESPIEDTPLSPSFSPCPLPEDVKVEAPAVRRSGYRRRKSFQGKRYTPEEDECICNAWLLISQDPFWGTIRRIDGFFERVADHFNKHIKRNAPRSIASVKGRWHFIRRVCTKFASYVAEVEKSDPIGASEADKVEMAKELWAKDDGGKPFLYEKCWRFLKDTPEWKLDSGAVPAPLATLCGLEGNSVDGAGAKALVTITNTEDGGTLAYGTVQPEGHKKAKLHKDSSPSATTSSNNVEMKTQELGREMLEDKDEKIKVREAKEAALEAQNSFYEFQKIEDDRQMEEAIRRWEEEDKRREEEDRRLEEANIRKEENAILATMVNDLDEELKASIMEQKRNIIARRRFDKIIKKEIPSKVAYEDDKVLAFRDISPQAPTHIILIPKVTDGLTGLSKAEERHTEILGYLLYVAKLVAKQEGLEDGFSFFMLLNWLQSKKVWRMDSGLSSTTDLLDINPCIISTFIFLVGDV